MADFLQTLIIAVTLGSLYALIALGYTMVYGVLKLINFAHSDIVVLGAWLSVVLDLHAETARQRLQDLLVGDRSPRHDAFPEGTPRLRPGACPRQGLWRDEPLEGAR
jgi:ABC-type branched-subunit amino acid transport system permease subunit